MTTKKRPSGRKAEGAKALPRKPDPGKYGRPDLPRIPRYAGHGKAMDPFTNHETYEALWPCLDKLRASPKRLTGRKIFSGDLRRTMSCAIVRKLTADLAKKDNP